MPREMRRVVTGHDAEGKSIVIIEGPATQAQAYWLTDTAPADNKTGDDTAQLVAGSSHRQAGTIFR